MAATALCWVIAGWTEQQLTGGLQDVMDKVQAAAASQPNETTVKLQQALKRMPQHANKIALMAQP